MPPTDPAANDTPGNALRRLREQVIPAEQKRINDGLDFELPLDVDLDGFARGGVPGALDQLESNVLRNLGYVLGQVQGKVSMRDRVSSVRIEPVAEVGKLPGGRAVFADGSRLIYRVDPCDGDKGYYYADDLEEILPGVMCGMAERIDPRPPRFSSPSGGGREGGSPSTPAGDRASLEAYRKEELPRLTQRVSALAGATVTFAIDWAGLEKNQAAAANLSVWGPNRAVGAVGLVALDKQGREDLSTGLKKIIVRLVATPDEKSIALAGGVLTLSLCLSEGEAGCFYEHAIAAVIKHALGTATKPVVNELRKQAAEWQHQLLDLFRRPITYEIDFAGFTSHPDTGKNLFALQLLREHGIDHLFYAVTGLAEKNPNFKQQFPQRVDTLRLVHVPRPEQKGIAAEGAAIVYRLSLHEGYTGYLTIKDMEKVLPEMVSKMRDAYPPVEDLEELLELSELSDDDAEASIVSAEPSGQLQHERAPDPGLADRGEFLFAVTDAVKLLAMYAERFAPVLGKRVAIEVDWASMGDSAEAVGDVTNFCVTQLLSGLAAVASDLPYRPLLHANVSRILIKNVPSPADQHLAIDDTTLHLAACLDTGRGVMLDPQIVAGLVKSLLDKRAEKKTPGKKKPAKRAAAVVKKSAKSKGKMRLKGKIKSVSKAKPKSKSKSKPAPKPKRKR